MKKIYNNNDYITKKISGNIWKLVKYLEKIYPDFKKISGN